MVRRGLKARIVVFVMAVAALVGGIAPSALAASPFVSASNEFVSLEVTDAPAYVVKGQDATYRYKIRANKNLNRVRLEPTFSACGDLGFGEMNSGNSTDFNCTFTATHAGMSVFNNVETRRHSYSGTEYLPHTVYPNVIDPKVAVEVLDLESNGGTWYVGQVTSVRGKVSNTGDVPLTNVSMSVGNCNFTITDLPVQSSAIRTCESNLQANQGYTSKTIDVMASASPNVPGAYAPSNFRATASATRTFSVFEPRALVGVQILNATNGGRGWPIANPLASVDIKLTNLGNMPANLSTTGSSTPACIGFAAPNVAVGASATFTCSVNINNPGTFNVTGRADVAGLPSSSGTWSHQLTAQSEFAVNPLDIFDLAVNPAGTSFSFKVANYGDQMVRVYRSNTTSNPACTSTNPLPTQTPVNPASPSNGPTTFTCSIAPGTGTATPAVKIAGIYKGQAFIARTGVFPIVPIAGENAGVAHL